MLVRQKIANLQNGVSQQPDELRHPSFGSVQENALDSPALGKIKRPPSVHVARIMDAVPGYQDSFVHTIRRDETEAYRVVVVNETLKVFDARSGEEYPVKPVGDALQYLKGTEGFRALTLGDTTLLTNRSMRVRTMNEKAPDARKEALLYVRQADFSTSYSVTLDGHTAVHTTVDASSPQARVKISTDYIASTLMAALLSLPAVASAFDIESYGSTLWITRKDQRDFQIRASDGLADKGLKVVKGGVQAFDDLPYKAKDGFVVEIVGDERSTKDNYWVVYDASGTADGAGVWRETIKPGTLLNLTAATLPHKLVRMGFTMPERVVAGNPATPTVEDSGWEEVEQGWTTDPGRELPEPEWSPSEPPPTPTEGEPTDEPAYPEIVYEPTRRRPEPGPVPSSEDAELREHTDRRQTTLNVLGERTVTLNYAVDAAYMLPGTQVLVVVKMRRSTGDFLPVETRAYTAGRAYYDETINIVGMFTGGEVVELQLQYGQGYTPAPSRRATIVAYGIGSGATQGGPQNPRVDSGRPPALRIRALTRRMIDFYGRRLRNPFGWGDLRVLTIKGLDLHYPDGSTITVTLDGRHTFSHTVTGGDAHADQVAEVFRGQIAANPLFTAELTMPGGLLVGSGIGLVAPEITVSAAGAGPRTAWIPGADLALGSLVGKILVNLTDGSEGWISANTASTITVAELFGGARDGFEKGDKVAVKDDPATPYFTFEPAYWNRRDVGDLETVPWPSFVGQRIGDLFLIQGRLGMIHGESVVLSRQGDLFNFFRETATDLLATDYIDVSNAHALTSDFHAAVPHGGRMMLLSEAGQYELSGEPLLTPQTVRLDLLSRFANTSRVRPLSSGSRLYLARVKGSSTQILEWTYPPQDTPHADDVTALVPAYLSGRPVALAGEGAFGFLAVLCDGQRDSLYVYATAFREDGVRAQGSWSRWVLPPGSELIHADVLDGSLGMLVKRRDGIFLESIGIADSVTFRA